ncbi:MAG: CobQ/CobB/MinD/ParA family protein [Anaerocolumna sp.]|jgi:MinD superfamily P-loop ATPase|nr:CobQ/CobB/MinD/ParA family protein [Anaerocolumna sp.]
MNIAVLSGKGGTGKTTVSTNLAFILGISYVDCDVEEPNGFIFLNPAIDKREEVYVEVPEIDQQKCSLCGACTKICQFNALAKAGQEIVVFEKLCHGCGACKLVCKYDAITYGKRVIGKIEKGYSKGIRCERGILDVGEPMAVPVIKSLLGGLPPERHIIDCPPGTSCNVVTALRYADAAILVTEPSEFSLHDLKLAIELVKQYEIPYGVVINKDDGMENRITSFCKQDNIPLLGVIPYSKDAAILYSNGIMLCGDKQQSKYISEIGKNIKEVFGWT